MIGNKCDLEKKRQVKCEEACKYAEEQDIMYMETSAKTKQGVEEAFEMMFDGLFE
jgi:GTPase SAR1 family protein